MKISCIILYLLCSSIFAHTQSISTDSMNRLLSLAANDRSPGIAAVNHLDAVANAYLKYNIDSGKIIAEQALAMAVRINYTKGEADALLCLTYCYESKMDFSKALERGLLCAAKYESIKDTKGLSASWIETAMLYKKIGGHKITEEYIIQGLDYSAKAYTLAKNNNDTNNMVDALNVSGIIYRDWGKKEGNGFYYDSAFNCYTRALGLINISTGAGEASLAKLYNNLSQVYSEYKNDYGKALEYLYKAVDNNRQHNKISSLSYNYNNISNIYASLGNNGKALEYAHNMLAVTRDLHLPGRLEDAYICLSKACELNLRFDSALYYFKLSSNISDSTLNIEKTAQIADIQTKYETLKKESEIISLNSSNKVKTKNIYFLSAVLLMVAILAVSMILLYQRIKKQKLQLQQQSDKLQWMMKELHHRVKNNLQIVSSLLNLQTYRMKDEASAIALTESNLRVQAMSLIHQRLYQAEDASLVNFRLFITDLTETLMAAYGFSSDDFDLHIDIQEEMLAVDAVLPLGLMVNEILTNSFKYAYKNVERPMLRIQLMQQGQQLQMDIADNGPGGQDVDKKTTGGFGKSLIDAFTRQLHATCQVTHSHGLAYHFTIPYKRQKQDNHE